MIESLRILSIIVALLATSRADQWVTPTPHTAESPNGKLQATITPAKHGKSGARVTVGPKGVPGKTYTMTTSWMPVDIMLLDDGSLFTLDNWHNLGHGYVATVHERDGKVRWTKTLVELIGQQLADAAQKSVSSIWWRKQPIQWMLSKDGKTVTITLFDENQLQVALRDGTPRILIIANPADDPKRMFNRAEALSKQPGHEAEAIALLEAALAKDVEHYQAILLIVSLLQRTPDHARVNKLLDRISPQWKTKDGYNIANAYVAWAPSLRAANREADAEHVLKLGIGAAPTYINPVTALATLLYDTERRAEGDRVMNDFVDRLFKTSYLDTYNLANAAGFYKHRKEHAKALAIYLKGYKPDQVTNQFLYLSLAELYKEMGKTADAIKVLDQLAAYFQKMGSAFDSNAKRVRDIAVRLHAKEKP